MSWTTHAAIIYGWDVTEDLRKMPEEKIDDFWDALCKTSEYICDAVSDDFLFIGTVISDIAEDERAIPMNITDLDWNLMSYRAYHSLEASGLKRDTKPKLYHVCYYS